MHNFKVFNSSINCTVPENTVELSHYKLIGKILYFRENAYSSFFFWLCEILLSYNPTSGRQQHHKKHLKETGLRDGIQIF